MFIQRAFKGCLRKDLFSFQRTFFNFSSQNVAFSLAKPNKVIDGKIEENITQKINSMQFMSLKEDIFNSQESTSYQNTDVLRLITLKSIQKKNANFANEVFETMIESGIVPDDATYTALMESLLSDGDTDDAFALYIHAYLNNVVLDLEIFFSLFERIQRKDISYVQVAYEILQAGLIPSKLIFDHVVYCAQKAKASTFLTKIYADMNRQGIKSVDIPKRYRTPKNYQQKKKRNMIIPIATIGGNGQSVQRGSSNRRDVALTNLLEDLALAVGSNKYKGGLYAAEYSEDETDEDYESGESSGENTDASDSESEELREDYTSDSDPETEK